MIPLSRLSVVCSAAWILLVGPPGASAQTRIRVEFTASDECVVTTLGPSGRASVTYPRRTTDLRCVVPALADEGRPGEVDVDVLLPPGHGRPVDAFPRLSWIERDGRWTGTGRLDGVPAFVRIAPDWGVSRWRTRALDAVVLLAAALAIAWSVVRGRSA